MAQALVVLFLIGNMTTSAVATAGSAECPRMLSTPFVRAAASRSLATNASAAKISLEFALEAIQRDLISAVRKENPYDGSDNYSFVIKDTITNLTIDQAVVCFPDLKEIGTTIDRDLAAMDAGRAKNEREKEEFARAQVEREKLRAIEDAERAQKDRERQVRAALAQAERERLQAIEDAKPENVLWRSYRRYAFVKRCHESRVGYAFVFVSDLELERGRIAVKKIEEAVKGDNPNIDLKLTWTEATADVDRRTLVRGDCQSALTKLEKTYREVAPDAARIEKDF